MTMATFEQSTCSAHGVVLACRDLRKSFVSRGRRIDVLKGVNLTVKTGEIVAIYGKSGAGKSTYLQILAGLDRPSAGSVTLGGISIESLSGNKLARMRREHIGIIFQHSNLLPSWTASENVEAAIYYQCLPRKIRRERAIILLRNLGLGNRWKHLPSELSAGEQQRVAIARALINDPRVIFADEPTGDVDPQTAGEIVELLVNYVRVGGSSLVLATHGTFPRNVADHWLTLADGVIGEPAGNNL
jgi:putative ABC transport system ATP-binding protein